MKKIKRFPVNVIFISVLFFILSCNNNAKNEEEKITDEKKQEKKENHEVHWSYEGETGPANWAKIVPGCACDGKNQSPIDISGDMIDKDFIELAIDYKVDSTLDIVNNGHTIQVNYPFGKLKFGDKEYQLAQFHFHAASEHTLKGKQFPLEAHLVHITADKQIAVIGIWFEEGKENELLKKIYDRIPAEPNDTISEARIIDVKNMLPKNHSYYYYKGSLTTPPCTEGVNWFVMKTPQQASKEQIEQIKKYMPANNFRPVQAVNDRKLEVYD